MNLIPVRNWSTLSIIEISYITPCDQTFNIAYYQSNYSAFWPTLIYTSMGETGSALVQVMAWRQSGDNQYWLIVNWILGKKFSEIQIKMHDFSLKKMHLKMPSAKRWPYRPEGGELMIHCFPKSDCVKMIYLSVMTSLNWLFRSTHSLLFIWHNSCIETCTMKLLLHCKACMNIFHTICSTFLLYTVARPLST